jgi:hypothetical protein
VSGFYSRGKIRRPMPVASATRAVVGKFPIDVTTPAFRNGNNSGQTTALRTPEQGNVFFGERNALIVLLRFIDVDLSARNEAEPCQARFISRGCNYLCGCRHVTSLSRFGIRPDHYFDTNPGLSSSGGALTLNAKALSRSATRFRRFPRG